jgi:glycosyltransferase involved in cell wall biosynthesis
VSGGGAERALKLVCLVNQYPKTSHSFIRREIAGLERAGVAVERVALRATSEPLVDARDAAERDRTRVVLDQGALGLAGALLGAALTRPGRFLRALADALALSRRSGRGTVAHVAYLAEACVLLRWCRAAAVDHVHAHFVTNAATVAWLCRTLGGPPFSFTAHGTNSFRDPEGQALTQKLADAAAAIAISEHGARALRDLAPDVAERVHVVRCGVDEAFLEPAGVPLTSAPRFVCVARLEEAKGVQFLLAAAASIAAGGRALEVVLVGDGAYRRELEALVGALGLADRVRFAGWLDNAAVRAEILAARALVLPSLDEGLPVVLMEALALGRPVIATDVGAIAELVETGVDGWLVPPGDAEALARALDAALAATPAELAELGARGAERVRERHDARREAARLAEVLGRVHARPERAAAGPHGAGARA